jgi:uncharacterized small protein (DUF1192 family)
MELDEWDKEWLARPHTADEYRAEIKSALERCAMYSARIERLEAELEKVRTAGCGYPDCLVDNRCARMWAGECAGPRA